ncbi:hypothetical protein M422DRAFT_250202 [Sphaerobolus stellatus SS14]|uniref:Uncharacterized protein n=1 Tax=Sphaerobolus stellatus (strain SS14) TaxID=990650 RepID=A0A0C9W491_SPHS4|nr:hypothetical protein M422DRAFT_250202 [Sphaerobolus stellatus SS14]
MDLNKLFLSLKKKEDAVAEQKQKAEEAQKRKEVAVPVTSGSGKGKGKSKEVVQDTDSESIIKEEFRETCLNCEENKAICNFMHPTMGKKTSCDRALKTVNGHIKGFKVEAKHRNMLAGGELYHKYNLQQLESIPWAHSAIMEVVKLDIRLREWELKLKAVGQSVPKDLLNDTQQGHVCIISKHNYIVCNCAFNMKQLVTWYTLGKGHEAKALLMDAQGGIEVANVMESGKKRMQGPVLARRPEWRMKW